MSGKEDQINYEFVCKKTGAKSTNSRTCINKYVATNLTTENSGRPRSFHINYRDMSCEDCEQGKEEYEKLLSNNKKAKKELDEISPEKQEVPKKKCNRCEKEYPATTDYFWKDNSKEDGLFITCKSCLKKAKANKKHEKQTVQSNSQDETYVIVTTTNEAFIANQTQLTNILEGKEDIDPESQIIKVRIISRYKLKRSYKLQTVEN